MEFIAGILLWNFWNFAKQLLHGTLLMATSLWRIVNPQGHRQVCMAWTSIFVSMSSKLLVFNSSFQNPQTQDVNWTYINVKKMSWTSSERLMYVQFTSCVYGEWSAGLIILYTLFIASHALENVLIFLFRIDFFFKEFQLCFRELPFIYQIKVLFYCVCLKDFKLLVNGKECYRNSLLKKNSNSQHDTCCCKTNIFLVRVKIKKSEFGHLSCY